MTSTPEFSRTFRLDELGGAARAVSIAAEESERAALAARFGLIGIERLEASADLMRDGDVVTANGRLEAEVIQACVASGDPVPEKIAEDFALRFVPAGSEESAEEIELDEKDLDEIDYEGGSIDLGEAVAQTMALALNPFPRAPSADAKLREAGVLGEEDAGPFAALKALKDKL
jgi:uncharacterized metal-binding protein YceD (DUF177 family)